MRFYMHTILLKAVLIIGLMNLSLKAVSVEHEKNDSIEDAILASLSYHGGFIRKLEPGERIWTSTDHVFDYIPEFLEGKGYLFTTRRGSKALVYKAGYVYVITPTPVEEHMSGRWSLSAAGDVIPYFRPNLIEQGFERMENVSDFQISNELNQKMAVYRKHAEAGEIIEYGYCWGVTVAGFSDDYENGGFKLPGPPVLAHKSPNIITDRANKYAFTTRNFQGIPGIEIASNGRLWVTWYANSSGVYTEGPGNYAVLVTSDDGGKTWSEPPRVVVDPKDWPVRAFDPVPWHDPLGRLWFIWTQNDVIEWGRGRSSWAIITEDSNPGYPVWSEPRRLAPGYMINKPTVLSSGEWIFPSSNPGNPVDLFISHDEGKNIHHLGAAIIPEPSFNEHLVVERNDGSLWLLARTKYGVGQSFSHDKGRTWTEGEPYRSGPCTRFHIRRLRSGRLLYIGHPEEEGVKMRTDLTAYLSEDEGRSWPYELLLDGREWVSYPDAVESPEGIIYSVHDHSRSGKMEIIMSVFTEQDIMAGKLVSDHARLDVFISGKERKEIR
jgi:hypothetical protein